MKVALSALLLAIAMIGCQSGMKPNRDVNAVMAAHTSELMAIPGVVGVYHGLAPNQKTECIKVMLKDKSVAAKIPKTLDGVPVITEVSGEIKPL
jgi:hypothetical protein